MNTPCLCFNFGCKGCNVVCTHVTMTCQGTSMFHTKLGHHGGPLHDLVKNLHLTGQSSTDVGTGKNCATRLFQGAVHLYAKASKVDMANPLRVNFECRECGVKFSHTPSTTTQGCGFHYTRTDFNGLGAAVEVTIEGPHDKKKAKGVPNAPVCTQPHRAAKHRGGN